MARARHGPEWYIQNDLIDFLEARSWLVERIIGNALQSGLPDLFCHHVKWSSRWIDCKVKGHYSFTTAQKIKWPIWERHGVGIWILTAATQEEYDLLFKPPNWRAFWKTSWDQRPDIDALLDEIELESDN
jgi:hypothetical protein